MDKTLTMPKTEDHAIDYKAAIDDMIRKMKQSDKRIERLRQDTERLKAETREILARWERK
jgi:hypothetical protein